MAEESVAAVLGPDFPASARPLRLPAPPLLLVDRIIGMAGEPRSLGAGTVWSETDIVADDRRLHHGRLPPGLMIESGQANIALYGWLERGHGERLMRLLGCEISFLDALPQAGDTLRHETRITRQVEIGGLNLFFFETDVSTGRGPILAVRNAQSGMFTQAELEGSEGIRWSAAPPGDLGPVEPGPAVTARRSFDRAAVEDFVAGQLLDCFGPGFERGASHTRSPGIPAGAMMLLETVSRFEPDGGPWGRGYLRAERAIAPDDWFFACHFKDDGCMPATLMLDGVFQAAAFYMAAHGLTLQRDGWRFEPTQGSTLKLRCRGQVSAATRTLTYELFVRSLGGGLQPTLVCDVICSADGQPILHVERLSLSLTPGWPDDLAPPPPRLADGRVDILSAEAVSATALGRPSFAMGEAWAPFDTGLRGPRLPGGDYQLMTRMKSASFGPVLAPGARCEAIYDIPRDAWYFAVNGARVMPYAVLIEVALQPCGWLSSAMGYMPHIQGEIFFRNLDGAAQVLREVTPDCGQILTTVEITKLSVLGAMILLEYDIRCEARGETVLTLKTGFGYFPEEALANQKGLPLSEADQETLSRPANLVRRLADRPEELFAGPARLATGQLLMLDRITGCWPGGGRRGLGLARGEKRVEPREWFFKAHFNCDPVQPGSLGIEALLQLTQALMLLKGMSEGLAAPRFESVALGEEIHWKYRGQVTPTDQTITTVVELLSESREAGAVSVMAAGALFVDGRKIYEAPRFGMRLVSGA